VKRIWRWLTGTVTLRARRIELLALFAILAANPWIRPWVVQYGRQIAGVTGIAIILLSAGLLITGLHTWCRGRARGR
jgi:hypothetical protein